ncbi:MAG TPA: portal protein [Alicycliphilus sp.]|nr:portal protein [Alicycliphilus sp.]
MAGDVETLLRQFGTIEDRRRNWESWWQQIAERVLPAEAQFTTTDQEGNKRSERIFTGKPIIDNERFAAVMDELLTPRTQMWHALGPEDDELQEDQAVKEYLERVNKLLFTSRYRPRANFASQKHQGYMSVGAFGNSCMYIDEEIGRGPRYRSIHLKEVFWCEDHTGRIDTIYRKFELEKRQAEKRAAEEGWQLPKQILEEKDPYKKFCFLHAVMPNEERVASRQDYRGMPWASYYIVPEYKAMVKAGGYTSWPYAIGRYALAASEAYGRSPAMTAWGAILTLNEEKKTILRAGQKEVDPPVLLQEDGVLDAFNLRPGALNYGAMSMDGTPLAQAFKTGANIPLGLELMGLEQMEIEEAFLVSIFKILAEHPQMTATQVLEITQQKATLLAPMMGRQQSEDLGPLIEREIDILSRDSRNSWMLEDMPESLRERGGAYKIEYRSPLARAMRAQDGVAIVRTFEALPAAVQIDPDSALVIDVPASLRELAEINGVPAKLVRDKDTVAQMVADKAERDQAAQMAAVAPEMSQAALNAAKAESLRAGA